MDKSLTRGIDRKGQLYCYTLIGRADVHSEYVELLVCDSKHTSSSDKKSADRYFLKGKQQRKKEHALFVPRLDEETNEELEMIRVEPFGVDSNDEMENRVAYIRKREIELGALVETFPNSIDHWLKYIFFQWEASSLLPSVYSFSNV
jgi:hypothetical protein